MLEWIEEEEAKWRIECERLARRENLEETSEIFRNLKNYVEEIRLRMGKYYFARYKYSKDVIAGMEDKMVVKREERGIRLVPVKFEYTTSTINGGYKPNHTICLNPNSAFLLYNTYRRFFEGDRKGIRGDIDFEHLTINDSEILQTLSRKELLYWCYVHKVSFEEFTKMTIIHEMSHHYGVQAGDDLDPKIINDIAEGMTEKNARMFAMKEKILYLPIYRQKSFELLEKLIAKIEEQGFSREEIDEWIISLSIKTDEYDLCSQVISKACTIQEDDSIRDVYGILKVLDIDPSIMTYTREEKKQIVREVNGGNIELSLLDLYEYEDRMDPEKAVDRILEEWNQNKK